MPYQPRATLNNPYGPQVTFRTEDVLLPTAYYVSPEDSIVTWLVTDLANFTAYLVIRMLLPTGEIKLLPYSFVPQSVNTWAPVFELPPVEGYILGAQCWSDNPLRGRCFVSMVVVRGRPPIMANAGLVLLQGYTNLQNVLSYPTSSLEATFSGRGAVVTINVASPITNGLKFVPGTFVLWKVLCLRTTFNTSAVVASRSVYVNIVDATSTQVALWGCSYSQPASTTVNYSFSPGNHDLVVLPLVNIMGPTEVLVPANGDLQVQALNFQAGDAFTSASALVEEWVGS